MKFQDKQGVDKEKNELMSTIMHRNNRCVVVHYPANWQLGRNSVVWAQDHIPLSHLYVPSVLVWEIVSDEME